MKTVLEEKTREELIDRINALTEKSCAAWGKMNVSQMVRHCCRWEEMIHENKKYKRVFIGFLLGKMLLKKEMQTAEIRKNSPTIPELIVTDLAIALPQEKLKLISLLKLYEQYTFPDYTFVHPFFGKMTREEVGRFAYKHIDHHLRQFSS